MEIQDIIKQRRLELNLTLKDVAKALNVAEATVSRYETGAIQNMGLDKISKLAHVLRCSPGYLMGWEEKPYNSCDNFHLSSLEKEIIQKFRTLTDGERAMFLRSINLEDEKGDIKKWA
ncbi:MAG: helix-turn-helix domain-containing protein [Lachnospiraceae bacterium]|nr:helix-turn-helix domain-containing protein [Lachnospiraceae bacterium]